MNCTFSVNFMIFVITEYSPNLPKCIMNVAQFNGDHKPALNY